MAEPRRKLQSEHRFGAKQGQPVVIDDVATFKALLDPIRHEIISRLEEPKSIRELAEELGIPAGRLYYHLDVLVDRGLAKVVDHKTSGTNVERIFARTANRFVLSAAVAESPVARSRATSDLQKSVARALEDFSASEKTTPKAREVRMGANVELRLTPAQAKEFVAKFHALVNSFNKRSAQPSRNERLYGLFALLAPRQEDTR